MALVDDKTREQVRERLARTLAGPVELRLYRRPDTGRLILPGGLGCTTCDATEELAQMMADAAPGKVGLEVFDVTGDDVDALPVPSLTVGRPGDEPRITFQGL